MKRGAMIPGLGMASFEFQELTDFTRLENPGVNGQPALGAQYSLEEIASFHIENLKVDFKANEPYVLTGMSMGGMILSIMASEFRSKLPPKTRFVFIATSANTAKNPSMPLPLLQSWMSVRPGDSDGFKRVFEPLFSPSFLKKSPEMVRDYIEFRTRGGNGQSPEAFKTHVKAVLQFKGEKFFPKIDPSEAEFLHGQDDSIFGESHWQDLKTLCPGSHQVLPHVGHMMNLEVPDVIERTLCR